MADNHDQRMERVRENEKRLAAITELNDDLWTVDERLEAAWAALKPLMEYYEGQWREDFKILDGTPDGEYGVFSEDGIWNEMGRFYEATKYIAEVAKRLVDAYERPTREVEEGNTDA
ncbi:DUF4298 domain-containing protein [uncultured Tessaracoccus sp.]|uniref:DUF4298 domain-containing protein n=1 Tax=uncultured Tessaracoccus sp. TaxID=905023 RepID=UPI00261F49BF|nr:DUF4298 domain-containing protein [uncultured Tessaracoccus sp.]